MSAIKKDEPAGTLERTSSVSGALAPLTLAGRISALARREISASRIGGGDLQVVFFCDTTGSMYPYFDRVRDSIGTIVERIAKGGMRPEFSVYAYKNHGDEAQHFDGAHPFLYQPFTVDPNVIRNALAEVRPGGGGEDGLCAVEDTFHHLNAQPGTPSGSKAKRVGVVIGDMPPHGVVDRVSKCPHEYDYRAEVEALHKKGFTFYSVFCAQEGELESDRRQKVREYYRWLPRETGGKYLDLTDIESLVDVLLGICMKETGRLDSFMAELGKRTALPATTQRLLLQLKAPGE